MRSLYKHWVHLKCNELNTSYFKTLVNSSDTEVWSCLKCNCELFPFNSYFEHQQEGQCPSNLTSNIPQEIQNFFTEMKSSFGSNFQDEELLSNINCKYYDKSEFHTLSSSSNFFSFLHLNISSIPKHFDNFQCFLNTLQHHFKVLAITESRILKSCSELNFDLQGYHFYSTPTEAQAGGTMLYLSNTLNSFSRKDLNQILYKPKLLESTFAEISFSNQSNLVVGSIYKHPTLDTFEFCNNFLSPLLEKTSREGKTLILLGDFNINLLNSGDPNVVNFLDILGNHLILPQILLPTRVTINSKTLIDNIFLSPNKFEKVSGNITTGISDHLPQFLLLKKSFTQSTPSSNYERDWKNFDHENFMRDFLNKDWDKILNIQNRDPDSSLNSFFDILTDLLEMYAPMRKLSKKQAQSKQKPWITAEIKKLIGIRDNFLKKFIKAKTEIAKEDLHTKYKFYRNTVVYLIRNSKNDYFKNYFFENSKNSKKIWQGINEYIKNKKSKNTNNITLNLNGNNITDHENIANIFNNFFTSIADNIRKSIPQAFTDFKKYLKNPLPNSFFFRPITLGEMIKTINSINSNKASGPNSIPPNILNLLLVDISEILLKIMNLSFETGIFPSSLKLVKVIPIFKNKGSEQDFNNYRPISLLSNIDKIFEKLVHSRLISFLDQHSQIISKQFGFRKKHSTAHTLISLIEEIRSHLDKGQFSCGVFIDLQKAFDTVDHNILLEKLKHYGVRGVANNWFKSYLSNRNQFVFISGCKSEIRTVKHGVPQGSVLGPLLFILYINDICNAITHSSTWLFADDTGLLNSNNSLKTIEKQLNKDLKSLYKWLCSSKISLNVAKTEVVLFHHEGKFIDHKIRLKLNGKQLSINKGVKYLGIYIDSNLSFTNHLEQLCRKLRNANGAISKIRHVASYPVLKSVFNSLFSSHISYACQSWAQNTNLNSSRVFKLQKAALRLLTFSEFQTPSQPLFYQLKILKISDLVKLRNLILIHEILNAFSPADISNTFNLNYYNNSHNTRGRTIGLLVKPQCRTTKFGLNSVTFQSISHWNDLQCHYKDIDLASVSQAKFYGLAFTYLLELYSA